MIYVLCLFVVSLFFLCIGIPFIKVITYKNVNEKRGYVLRYGLIKLFSYHDKYWDIFIK